MLERINPTVKACTVMAAVILLSFQYIVVLNSAVFLLCIGALVLFSKARLRQIVLILVPAFLAAFGMFMMGLYYSKGSSFDAETLSELSSVPFAVRAAMSRNLDTALQLSTRLLAYAGLGILFALSTDGEHFVHSLIHQAHLSPKFAYSILAAFHLMPNLQKEYRQVRIAFAVRGIKVGFFSMKVIFTMLVNCVRWSESVAMARESKGFTGKRDRTYYMVIHTHWYDWVFLIGVLSSILVGMLVL